MREPPITVESMTATLVLDLQVGHLGKIDKTPVTKDLAKRAADALGGEPDDYKTWVDIGEAQIRMRMGCLRDALGGNGPIDKALRGDE